MENQNDPSQTSPEPTSSQPPNLSSQPLPENKPHPSFLTNKLFLITVVILILFTLAYTGIYLSLNSKLNQISKSNPTPTIPPSASPAASDAVGETANWKTYKNEEKGYLIKYPNDVFIRTVCSNKELILEHRDLNELRDTIEVPACGRGGRFTFEVLTFDALKGEKPYSNYTDYSISQKDAIIAGINTKVLTLSYIDKEDPESSDWLSKASIKKGDKTYELTLGDKDLTEVFDQILSTFKFSN